MALRWRSAEYGTMKFDLGRAGVGLAALLWWMSSAAAQTLGLPKIVERPELDEPIVTVRRLDTQFAALGQKGSVWLSREGSTWWERVFKADAPLADILSLGHRYVLVSAGPAGTRRAWLSADKGDRKKWTELRGPVAGGVSVIYEHWVSARVRGEGAQAALEIFTSKDAEQWSTHAAIPAELGGAAGPVGDDYLFRHRLYRVLAGKVVSSGDLRSWQEEFAWPAAGPEAESRPRLASSGSVLLAVTQRANGPVRVYRRFQDAPWQRIEPLADWREVESVTWHEFRFVAGAARGRLNISRDGRTWRPVTELAGHSPRFGADSYHGWIFGGPVGKLAVLKPTRDWDEFGGVETPAFAWGANWENTRAGGTADEIWEQVETAMRFVRDDASAMKRLLEAVDVAETGSSTVKLRLADVVAQGAFGVPKDEARALKLLESAANAGNGVAQLDYAAVLAAGRLGLTADPARGAALVQEIARTAETAAPEVQFKVAVLIVQGGAFGLTRDLPRALALMTKAAESGLVPAQAEAGRAWIMGVPGVPADPARGVVLLKRAAEWRFPAAAALLGQVYEQGVGVPRDLAAAAAWYQKAIEFGLKEAEPALKRVQAAAAAK